MKGCHLESHLVFQQITNRRTLEFLAISFKGLVENMQSLSISLTRVILENGNLSLQNLLLQAKLISPALLVFTLIEIPLLLSPVKLVQSRLLYLVLLIQKKKRNTSNPLFLQGLSDSSFCKPSFLRM